LALAALALVVFGAYDSYLDDLTSRQNLMPLAYKPSQSGLPIA